MAVFAPTAIHRRCTPCTPCTPCSRNAATAGWLPEAAPEPPPNPAGTPPPAPAPPPAPTPAPRCMQVGRVGRVQSNLPAACTALYPRTCACTRATGGVDATAPTRHASAAVSAWEPAMRHRRTPIRACATIAGCMVQFGCEKGRGGCTCKQFWQWVWHSSPRGELQGKSGKWSTQNLLQYRPSTDFPHLHTRTPRLVGWFVRTLLGWLVAWVGRRSRGVWAWCRGAGAWRHHCHTQARRRVGVVRCSLPYVQQCTPVGSQRQCYRRWLRPFTVRRAACPTP